MIALPLIAFTFLYVNPSCYTLACNAVFIPDRVYKLWCKSVFTYTGYKKIIVKKCLFTRVFVKSEKNFKKRVDMVLTIVYSGTCKAVLTTTTSHLRKGEKNMNKKAKTSNATPNIKTVACYHGSEFESLKFFNSDRAFNLNDDYTISSDNSASSLRIMKAGSPIQSQGIELELECTTITDSTVLANVLDLVFKTCFPDDFFRMERDGSLGGASSAECVTQTFSRGWMRNNYKNFKTMYEYFNEFGINPGARSCGMHVNIGLPCFGKSQETQDDAIRKFWYVVANNYDFMRYAVRRDGHSTTWSGALFIRTKDEVKNMNLHYMPSSHEYCLNYSHYNQGRIEFRLVGGQPNFKAFMNTMEVVFHLIDASKRLSWSELDDLTKVSNDIGFPCGSDGKASACNAEDLGSVPGWG